MSSTLSHEDLLSHMEKDAQALTNAALGISKAVAEKNQETLDAALQMNLEIWTGIRVVMGMEESPVAKETRENLMRLSQYVTKTSHELTQNLQETTAETLVNINLQIAEGLLEGIAKATQQVQDAAKG
jgi:flagellar biosynthesis regulator FlaF